MSSIPILYSYRRCPYAMRARMALDAAEIAVEIREISLREKPKHLLACSPKGTVPVLVLKEKIIDESLDIMQWALSLNDPEHWMPLASDWQKWVKQNDTAFKRALDGYKYPERYPQQSMEEHRADAEKILAKLEYELSRNLYLLGPQPCIADVAIFPFIRQFAAVDSDWFHNSPYIHLQKWLTTWVSSPRFDRIMQKGLRKLSIH